MNVLFKTFARSLNTPLVVLVIFSITSYLRAADALDAMVEVGYSFKSFDEAIQQIRSKTSFEVYCPEDLANFMRSTYQEALLQSAADASGQVPKTHIESYLNGICTTLCLSWKYDPSRNLVLLDVGWKKEDSRTPAELLTYLRDHASLAKKDPEWKAALHALLSHPANFAKAWLPQQTAVLYGHDQDPLLFQPIISDDGQIYTLAFFNDPSIAMPGNNKACYYWFKNDGILAGAGLMNTGHRSFLSDAQIVNPKNTGGNEPREVHLLFKVQGGSYYIGRFHLAEDRLRRLSLIDSYGNEEQDHPEIGGSLLK